MNIHGTHSYWKQGALGAAGVRRVRAGAGPQRAAYRGGGISCGLAHSLLQQRYAGCNCYDGVNDRCLDNITLVRVVSTATRFRIDCHSTTNRKPTARPAMKNVTAAGDDSFVRSLLPVVKL